MRVRIAGLDLPLATVQDLIDMADEAFTFERQQLLSDMQDAGLEADAKLERLRELSMRKGTGALLIMATFRIDTASRLVKKQLDRAARLVDINPAEILAALKHEEITSLSQQFIGYRERSEEDPQTAAESK